MKKYNINRGEADHVSAQYYLADEVDAELAALTAEVERLREALNKIAQALGFRLVLGLAR